MATLGDIFMAWQVCMRAANDDDDDGDDAAWAGCELGTFLCPNNRLF